MTTEIEIQPQVELNMEQNDGLVSKDDGVKRRPTRTIRKPVRFRNDDHIDPDDIDSTQTNVDNDTCKVKRILAKKLHKTGFLYLVQMVGEPSQNAAWETFSELPAKAQELPLIRPPPLIG